MIGYMPMPAGFRHRELFYAGRPVHQKFDDFWFRHPTMSTARRAKIFAPFDALKGFSDAVSSKEVLYEKKKELSSRQSEALESRLSALSQLTANGKLARENAILVTVEYYLPCRDQNHAAYGRLGFYEQYTGQVRSVDFPNRLLYIDMLAISLDDIRSLSMPEQVNAQSDSECGCSE